MGTKSLIGIDHFLTKLCSIEAGLITRDNVLDLCESVQISDASLAPYLFFDEHFYTRNLIYRDDLFEVLAICWESQQRTAVHTHNGQLCWMIMQRGGIQVVDYKWLGCDHPEHQNVVGMDCTAESEHVKLDRIREVECSGGGQVVTADKLQTIHQLFNANERTVSIHIYSRPIDSCVAFDLKTQHCYRRQLSYFSQYGSREFKEKTKTLPVLNT